MADARDSEACINSIIMNSSRLSVGLVNATRYGAIGSLSVALHVQEMCSVGHTDAVKLSGGDVEGDVA